MVRPSPACIEMIEKLISFDTTSRDSNLALIAWVQGYLKDHGVESELVHDETGKKANLYATLGPAGKPGICLSGHTDVVPIDGQEWHSNPFEVIEKDGKLYGRGACDMKSFVAVSLAYVPEFLKRGVETPIHLAFSYDEEVGCLGVRRLIDTLSTHPSRPALCIVGEPTGMKVVRAHKGKLSFRCHVRGFEAHSSLAPHGVNAVEMSALVIVRLRAMADEKRENGPFDRDFDVPYTTVHTGVVRGGTQLNIVPKDCQFDFEFRHLPADDPKEMFAVIKRYAEDELQPAMRAIAPDAGFTWNQLSMTPGLDSAEDDEAVELAKNLTGANATSKVAFGTEAGLFQKAGIPTVICGPGSIDQAHKPNEFVSLDQVALCEAMMRRLVDRVCRPQR